MWWSETTIGLPPTIGKFENGLGEFFADDVEGGKPVRVRFYWTAGERPSWEHLLGQIDPD